MPNTMIIKILLYFCAGKILSITATNIINLSRK